jgi:lipopolysaccharide export system protein LptC
MAIQPDPPRDIQPSDARPLSFISPRTTRRAERARDFRTTRLIGRLRFFLPATGAMLLIVLVAWPWIDPNKIRSMVVKNIPDLVIEHLHFTGLDSKNQPYSMIAARATRPGGLQNIYDLDKPEGEITLTSGSWVAGKALYGRYDQSKRQLWLGGDVQLFHDKGYQFTTDEAQVDIDDDNAWGEKPVLIQGDFGEIRGKGFRVLDSGKVVVVKGPAKAIINLRPAAASDTPAGATKP